MQTVLIDYQSGNLHSAEKAFERMAREVNAGEIVVTSDAEVVAKADRIVLPGDGAFPACRTALAAVPGMDEALAEAVTARGRPLLGICVGMQLMADRGLEHGVHPGLGWIGGEVVAIDPDGRGRPALKVPHMGWNEIRVLGAGHPVLADISDGTHFYFVHGYHLRPALPEALAAVVDYGDPLAAVVARDNLIGTQFHPEKSQAAGLRLLHNFARWSP